uniref:Phosphotransferase n=1 Tax=Noccaea caerulescens TaxID=107243 RepID=A0A1J3G182_NOCCA
MRKVVISLCKSSLKDGETQESVIAMDSGIFDHYTQFSESMKSSLKELLGDEVSESVQVILSNDGSGIGAALLAASHSQYLQLEEDTETR